MQISRSAKRWTAFIVCIILVLAFYGFRWGILGIAGIEPPRKACEDIDTLNVYLHTGGNPSAYLGRVPLIMCATEVGSYEVVSRLVDVGANVNSQKRSPYAPVNIDPSTKATALHVSVREGNFEITKILFENGADINDPAGI